MATIRLSKTTGEWGASIASADVDTDADGQFADLWRLQNVEGSRSHCIESAVFKVTDQVQAFTVQLPLAVTLASVKFTFLDANLGDSLHLDVGRGVLIGVIKEDAAAGDTSVVVSESAYDTLFTGCDLVTVPAAPTDAASTSDAPKAERYTVTRVKSGVVRFCPPLSGALPAGNPLSFAVPVMKDFPITRVGEFDLQLGGRFLPQKCPLTLVYTGRNVVEGDFEDGD